MTKTVSGLWDKEVGFRIEGKSKTQQEREIKAEGKESSEQWTYGTLLKKFNLYLIEKALVLWNSDNDCNVSPLFVSPWWEASLLFPKKSTGNNCLGEYYVLTHFLWIIIDYAWVVPYEACYRRKSKVSAKPIPSVYPSFSVCIMPKMSQPFPPSYSNSKVARLLQHLLFNFIFVYQWKMPINKSRITFLLELCLLWISFFIFTLVFKSN